MNQILQSFVLRNPGAVFYAKGKEKTEFLAKYLDRKIENLDDLGCPRVENLYFKNYPSCNKHIPHYNSRNHCALKKTKVFYDWLKNEQQREISESGDIPITKFNALCVDDSRDDIKISLTRIERIDCSGQIVQRKEQVIISEEELSTLKRFFPVIDQFVYFQRFKFIRNVSQQARSISSRTSLSTQTSARSSDGSKQQ